MIIFDGHNDSLTQIYLSGQRSFFEESRFGHIDLPRARKGNLAGGFFAIFTPPDSPERDLSFGLTITDNGYAVSPRSPLNKAMLSNLPMRSLTMLTPSKLSPRGK